MQFLPTRVISLITSSLVKSSASSTKNTRGLFGSFELKLKPFTTSNGIKVMSSLFIARSVSSFPSVSFIVDNTGVSQILIFSI